MRSVWEVLFRVQRKAGLWSQGPYSAPNLALATQRVTAPMEKGRRGAGLRAIRPLGVLASSPGERRLENLKFLLC